MNRLGWGTAAACLLAAAMAPQAGAQEVLHSPDAVRACICRDAAMNDLGAAVRTARQNFEAQQKTVNALDQQADAAKAKLDPANLGQRQAFAQLLTQRDAARQRLAADATPHYNAAVRRYNAAIVAYQGDCAGKQFDADTVAHVRASLSCPPVMAEAEPVTAPAATTAR